MPDVKYPKNPNSETAFVEENGQKARAIKIAVVDGTIDYPKNANSDSCYVTIDGQKQRALMVADVSSEGTVEYPNNPNSTKGYVEIDGKKQRVILTASLVGGGSTPTGTITITENGEHDVTNYATADVQVPTTAPAHYVEKTNTNGYLTNDNQLIDLTGVTTLGERVLSYAYYSSQFPANTQIDFSGITTIANGAMTYTFGGAQGISSVDLSGVTSVGSNGLQATFSDSSITSLDLSSLEEINQLGAMSSICANSTLSSVDLSSLRSVSVIVTYLFEATNLVTLSFPSLTEITISTFGGLAKNCQYLTTVNFPVLSTISKALGGNSNRVFGGCLNLSSVSFGGLKSTSFGAANVFQYLFDNTTGSTATGGCTVHFPSNFDPTDPDKTYDITTLTGYPTFGGSASYINLAYDLPATE